MNDQGYISKGIKLADEWDLTEGQLTLPGGRFTYLTTESGVEKIDVPQYILDALAAQLVRQVDAMDDLSVITESGCSLVHDVSRRDGYSVGMANHEGPDRTMNTIKAIVDSDVLNNG